jgi:DNA-binding NarL/FixJ family response regulator
MKILIADDHPLFRDAFKGILLQLYADADITEKVSFDELMLLKSAEQFTYDMAFIDLAMPKGEPFKTIAHLSGLNPNTPIVVVSGEESQDVVRNAIASGATGFLPKSLDTDSLISNLKHILSGAMSIVTPVLKHDSNNQSATGNITARQTEVLELMCEGKTNKMIAKTLGLTEGTVKLHVRAVLQALGASNRTQAVAIVKKRSVDNIK